MKVGQPPGSSGLSNSQQSSGQGSNGFGMGGLGGPVKAAHHNRQGMGASKNDERGSPSQNYNSAEQQQEIVRGSPPQNKSKVPRNSGSPTSSFINGSFS